VTLDGFVVRQFVVLPGERVVSVGGSSERVVSFWMFVVRQVVRGGLRCVRGGSDQETKQAVQASCQRRYNNQYNRIGSNRDGLQILHSMSPFPCSEAEVEKAASDGSTEVISTEHKMRFFGVHSNR